MPGRFLLPLGEGRGKRATRLIADSDDPVTGCDHSPDSSQTWPDLEG
ncbi:MAG: hypothetical protein JWM45_1111, partial [Pseudonocardiales bacterium]|nr:hypothetical protein [Pseudonocardiales bacterium]